MLAGEKSAASRLPRMFSAGTQTSLKASAPVLVPRQPSFDFYKRHSKFMIVFRQAYSLEPDISKYQFETLAKCVAVMPNYLKRWGGPKRETEARLRLNLLTIQLSDIATRLLQGDIDLDKDKLIDVLLEYWTVGLRDPGPIIKSLTRTSAQTKRPS